MAQKHFPGDHVWLWSITKITIGNRDNRSISSSSQTLLSQYLWSVPRCPFQVWWNGPWPCFFFGDSHLQLALNLVHIQVCLRQLIFRDEWTWDHGPVLRSWKHVLRQGYRIHLHRFSGGIWGRRWWMRGAVFFRNEESCYLSLLDAGTLREPHRLKVPVGKIYQTCWKLKFSLISDILNLKKKWNILKFSSNKVAKKHFFY